MVAEGRETFLFAGAVKDGGVNADSVLLVFSWLVIPGFERRDFFSNVGFFRPS